MQMKCIYLELLFLLSLSAQTFGAVYHVAQQRPAADDANPGTTEKPWRTISKAAAVLMPGDRVIVHAGIYREWVNPKNSGKPESPITYEAAPGEEVILTGADVATGWIHDAAAVWRLDNWTTRFMVSPDKDYHPVEHVSPGHQLIGRAEQVIVDGKLLKQVLRREEMKPGTFCADASQQRLYVWLADSSDPNTHTMEVGKRGWVFGVNPWLRPEGVDDIHVRGFTIRHASNHAQRGALYILGNRWVVEDVTVEWTSGCGWTFRGRDHVFRRIISRHNGQMGGDGSGGSKELSWRFLMEDCVFADNNRKGFSVDWAGGIKIAYSRDGVMRRCIAVRNDGPGLWLDGDNRNVLITECYAADNTCSGIYVEVSGWCTLTNNLCVRNGTGSDRDLEGWATGGIKIGESRNCVVKNNTCVYNRDGIVMRELGPRTSSDINGRISEWFCTENVFTHNIMAYNRGFQFAYWSVNHFYGEHPSQTGGDLNKPIYDPAKMKFVIDHNLYYPPKDRPLQLWGCPWLKRSRTLKTMDEVRSHLGFDSHSLVADPKFADPRTDSRLLPDSPARRRQIGPLVAPATLAK